MRAYVHCWQNVDTRTMEQTTPACNCLGGSCLTNGEERKDLTLEFAKMPKSLMHFFVVNRKQSFNNECLNWSVFEIIPSDKNKGKLVFPAFPVPRKCF